MEKKFVCSLKNLDISDISLIVANLIPLFGSLFLGWDLFSILIIYWLESGVIGFYTILKMFISPAVSENQKTAILSIAITNTRAINILIKIFCIPFFIAHYAGFMSVHLIFIIALSSPTIFTSPGSSINLPILSKIIIPLTITTLSLFISHGISFYTNFIKKQEFRRKSTQEIMFSPYGRIVIMHLTLLFGGFLIISTGLPKSIIVLFVIFKIIVDLRAHKKEHNKQKRLI